MAKYLIVTVVVNLFVLAVQGQDSATIKEIPLVYLDQVNAKAAGLEQKLDRKSEKSLQQMQKVESRMYNKLKKMDSLKAKELFGNGEQKYQDLKQRLMAKAAGKQYISTLDTLSTSLKFLQQNPQLISTIKGSEQKLKEALSKVNGLEDKFQKAEEIKQFLNERKQFLRDQLSKLGFTKELNRIAKNIYYLRQQVNEYKSILQDKKKAERKVMDLLSRSELFKKFMQKNSLLASLFRMPGDDPSSFGGVGGGLAGLQTRAQVNNLIQQTIAGGGPNAQAQFSQNMQDAQGKMNELKEKILRKGSGGGGSSGEEMPEGFKPNDQKTKSFFKRLEYGTNIQTQKATNFFPVTSDIGLSLGYKLNDRSVIGIGASYKMGMGRGWNNIRVTNQGAGLRSFIDWKIKGSFWISGGYEQNYKTQLSGVLMASPFGGGREGAAWQQSGLIGLSKVISLKTKFFKKTKLSLLWDFMSYQQVPRTQAVLFRVGYGF